VTRVGQSSGIASWSPKTRTTSSRSTMRSLRRPPSFRASVAMRSISWRRRGQARRGQRQVQTKLEMSRGGASGSASRERPERREPGARRSRDGLCSRAGVCVRCNAGETGSSSQCGLDACRERAEGEHPSTGCPSMSTSSACGARKCKAELSLGDGGDRDGGRGRRPRPCLASSRARQPPMILQPGTAWPRWHVSLFDRRLVTTPRDGGTRRPMRHGCTSEPRLNDSITTARHRKDS
jgi:hypothetical protein